MGIQIYLVCIYIQYLAPKVPVFKEYGCKATFYDNYL
jgi:hypothetical protein